MKTIMVVDDNEDLRNLLKRIFEKEGFETILAADGDECLEQLKNNDKKPDLILLDIMMPGIPIPELIEKIEDVKIAFLSAVEISDRNKVKLLSQKNVIDYIPKPFEKEELVKIVKKLVGE